MTARTTSADRVSARPRTPTASRATAPGAGVTIGNALLRLLLPICLTLVAAVVFFWGLDVQSFDSDEAVTVLLVHSGLGRMLSRIPQSESTPPLYYLLAWCWAKVFGNGEIGLRSLSALLGTATVPFAYGAAAALVSKRTAAVLTALFVVNPLIVWHAQQARAYSLLLLLCTISLFYFARALKAPKKSTILFWSIASIAALSTHYFAAFVLAPEAIILLLRRRERSTWLAVGAVAAAALALLPLAVHQQGHTNADWIEHENFLTRLVTVPKQYLVGVDAPLETVSAVIAGALIATGLALFLTLGDQREREGGFIAGAVGVGAIVLVLAAVGAGFDYFITRNVLVAWVPLLLVAAAGFGAHRAGNLGLAAGVALCGLFAALTIGVATDARYQRDDWRGIAKALGPAKSHRIIVLTGPNPGSNTARYFGAGPPALAIYLPRTRQLEAGRATVNEVDLVGVAPHGREERRPPRPPIPQQPVPGMHLISVARTETFTLARYRLDRPTVVSAGQLSGLGKGPTFDVIQRPWNAVT